MEKLIYTVNALCDLEPVSNLYRDLQEISAQGSNTEDEKVLKRSLRAEKYMYEIDEVEEIIYPYSTVTFASEKEYFALRTEGFFPRIYNGDYVKVFDVYISGILGHDENYIIYFPKIKST